MDELSAHQPLLSTGALETDNVKKKPFLLLLIKRTLKVLLWVVFLAWVTIMFLYPAEFMQKLQRKWILATEGTVFGISGSIFLMFSGPILIIAILSFAYIIVSAGEEDYREKKGSKKFPRFRLSTFPVLVEGPFGVVSAAELIGILLFTAYVIWALCAYTFQDLNLLSKFEIPSKEKSYFMLELSGLRLGTIGLFCMVFLFLPISRGSILLRLVDIPFEQATRYHVWLGHLTMVLFTLHGLFYMVAWALQGKLLREIFQWKDIGVAIFPGVISLVSGLFLWVTTLNPLRRKYFELFFYTHQLYIVFVVFLALHVGDFIFCIVAGGIFLFLLDRFLRFWQSRKSVDIISATCFPCGTVELVLSKPKNMRYNALSFIFLQMRELSWLQWHPFSVSSSPLDGKYHLSILIKVLGEWTRNLRDNILNIPEGHQEEFPFQAHSKTMAFVEGPYGHESAYHLMYENLILVAGGIGISPFLAILRDILHRIKDQNSCLTKRIVIVWAVKKSKELSLLSSIDVESICPSFSNKLQLDFQTYITQELEPTLEEGKLLQITKSHLFPMSNASSISGLVGTGNNIWFGIYIIISIIGFALLLGLMDLFYIKPFSITCWWFKGLLFVVCMITSVFVFGGLVVISWHIWERSSSNEKCVVDKANGDAEKYNNPMVHSDACERNHFSLGKTQYGQRPNFKEIFGSISKCWGHVDVGVIVCGPPNLLSSVAKECRSQNIRGEWNRPFFHFHTHSFDL
ncbi:PREDICTED: ferric reduction oxidase 7, chloroplastic-like [Nelumbo nucifera]|uniref:Ferric reduction oxidase 7, chloroplastic-like n=1 Tax=Nelumbo nucifera TaxID=4432 RepID=A0A1U8AF01_NELNU|nr:PREDICTED: ferric reduction oxidase 7, chloroplastic-like [Nelumbo nucifera]